MPFMRVNLRSWHMASLTGDQLQSLLGLSKSPNGRLELLTSGKLSEVAGILSSREVIHWQGANDMQQLLPVVRILRNSCALPSASKWLTACNAHVHAAQLAATLAQQQQQHLAPLQQPPHPQTSLLLAAVQLLSNMSASSPEAATAVWATLIPGRLAFILRVPLVAVHQAAALMVMSCVRASQQALSDVTAAAARPIWQQLLAPLMPNVIEASSSGAGAALQAHGAGPMQAPDAVGPDDFSPPHAPLAAGAAGGNTCPFQTEFEDGNDNLCLLVFVIAVQLQHLEQLLHCVASRPVASSAAGPTGRLAAAEQAAEAVAAAAAAPGRQQAIGSCVEAAPGTEGNGHQQAADWRPCQEQALLLHILAAEIGAQPLAEGPLNPGASTAGVTAAELGVDHCAWPWVVCLVQLLRKALPLAVCSMQSSSSSSGGGGGESSSGSGSSSDRGSGSSSNSGSSSGSGIHRGDEHQEAAHVLEAVLQVLRAILEREDAGGGLAKSCSSSGSSDSNCAVTTPALPDCREQLRSLGLVELLLDMLRQLGPPPKPHQQQQQAAVQAVHQQAPTAGCHASSQQQGQQAPRAAPTVRQPYAGYRADLVAVLSNMLFENTAVQDQVLAAGGVEVLLSNCTLDPSAPVAREWALWAVRNMCSNNEAVQKYIAEFQAVEAVPSPELAQMGKELQLDKMTHKLRLVDQPQQQQVQ